MFSLDYSEEEYLMGNNETNLCGFSIKSRTIIFLYFSITMSKREKGNFKWKIDKK